MASKRGIFFIIVLFVSLVAAMSFGQAQGKQQPQ